VIREVEKAHLQHYVADALAQTLALAVNSDDRGIKLPPELRLLHRAVQQAASLGQYDLYQAPVQHV
jgi:hypothetical protein